MVMYSMIRGQKYFPGGTMKSCAFASANTCASLAAPSQPQSEYVEYILKDDTKRQFCEKTLSNFDINHVNGQEGSIGCDCH
jgi:hypothetical protein